MYSPVEVSNILKPVLMLPWFSTLEFPTKVVII